MADMTEEQVTEAAVNIMFFQDAVTKLGGDKEPTSSVGTGSLNDPWWHIAPNAATEASWAPEDQPGWVVYAKLTGLNPDLVFAFDEWWGEFGHKHPDCVSMIYQAMGHDPDQEELSIQQRRAQAEAADEQELLQSTSKQED